MSKINKLSSYLLCISLVIATLLSVVDFCCFDRNFYASEQRKLNIAEDIGVNNEELDEMTTILLGYLKHENDDLFVTAKVKGSEREIFNQREKDHMIDVRNLYDNAINVRNISLGLIIVCVIYLFYHHKLFNISYYYNQTLLLFAFIFGFIGLFCLIDFNAFWTSFHELFFPMNDLWLLDPRVDILIMMVPEQFFFDLVTKIIIIVAFALVAYFIAFRYLRRKIKNA